VGGNSKVSGVCNNVLVSGEQNARLPDGCGYYCQCINGAATTLSAYTDLRAVTTITTSVSSEESAFAVATFAAV